VFTTAVPITKLFAWGEGDSGGGQVCVYVVVCYGSTSCVCGFYCTTTYVCGFFTYYLFKRDKAVRVCLVCVYFVLCSFYS
jgi:hypothetical protein